MVTAIVIILGFAVLAYLGLGLVLFLRDTFVSRRVRRGASSRLRHPQPERIEALTGLAPSEDLLEFYRVASFLEWQEFDLTDPAEPSRTWTVAEFIPLCAGDVEEALRTFPTKGAIPLAWAMTRGAFFVVPSGAVVFRNQAAPEPEQVVAPSIKALLTFDVKEG